jgi:hypothetical protein
VSVFSFRSSANTAVQYGDERERALLSIVGPIPRYSFAELDDEELGRQIKRRWMVRRTQMLPQIVMDMRLLRFIDPERIQDQWQNVWSGKPLAKMYHNAGLSVNQYNWTAPIIEALTGLIAGGKPRPYDLDLESEDSSSESGRLQADIAEKYCTRVYRKQRYQVTFLDGISGLWSLGRRWTQVTTNPETRMPEIRDLWPGSVAAFWQHDRRTIEQVITSTRMLPGEAAALYPDKKDEINAAVTGPYQTGGASVSPNDSRSPLLASGVTIMTCWYRTLDNTIGQCVVLLNDVTSGRDELPTIILSRDDDTGYTDIPLRCTPKFRVKDRNPDEAQGVLLGVAQLQTEYNEVMSAFHDMLWRAIYQRYKAKNFVKPPKLLKGTNIYAMRGDQDILRLDEQVNQVPVEAFINRLENMLIILPGLNKYFLNSAPPSETSGDSIVASINASITRIEPVRTNIQDDETWLWEQVLEQAAAFGVVKDDIGELPLRDVLGGPYFVNIGWIDVTPKDAVKAKQLALAGLKAGVISLETAQNEWRILSKTDEQRAILRERTDARWSPSAVQQTAQALMAQIQVQKAKRDLSAPPPQAPPPQPHISLKGDLTPEQINTALTLSGEVAPQPQGQPGLGSDVSPEADANVSPSFESDNSEPTGMPATYAGDAGNGASR